MVSSDESLDMYPRKKKKRGMEDNVNSVEEGARLKVNQEEKCVEQMILGGELVDLISELPDHVIHHIFSFLQNVKDVVRTSSFSKRWKALWFSYAVLILDEQNFAAGVGSEDVSNTKYMFREYVSNSLVKYLENNLQIQKLWLSTISFDLSDTPFVDLCLTVALLQNIKVLFLDIGFKDNKRYTIPQAIFSSETLTAISLSSCILQSCSNIVLPCLRKLYLHKVRLAENIVQHLISHCHSVEDLRFLQCSGLKLLSISHPRLSRLEIHNCIQLKKVDTLAPNLGTFWFSGKKSTSCKVSLEDCKYLKNLTIEHPQVSRDFCKNQFNRFPLLEQLDLCISDKMKSISICHGYIRSICLKGCKKLSYAQLVAFNLVSFEMKGENVPYIDFVHPFRLKEAKLYFESKTRQGDLGLSDKLWLMMRPFISRFSPEGYKLIMHSKKYIIIHEDLNHIEYPPLPDLGFVIIKSSARVEDILHGFLRTLHPISISIVSSSDSKFHESVYEMIKIKDEEPVCCRYNTSKNKCWRHFLKDVKVERLEETINGIKPFVDESSTLYIWLYVLYMTEPCQMHNIRLSWNSNEP